METIESNCQLYHITESRPIALHLARDCLKSERREGAVPEHWAGVKHHHYSSDIRELVMDHITIRWCHYNFQLDTTELKQVSLSSINWTDSLKFVRICRYLRSLRARLPNIPVSLSECVYTSRISSYCQSKQRLDWVIETCSVTW